MTNQTTKVKAQDKTKMCEIDDQILKMFEIKKRLGKGAYGIVWKALDKRSNEIVAVKKIFDAFRDETDAQRTFREIIFLNAFRSHPNIVKLHGVFKASNNLDIYLVFEYMESDLHNIIKRGTVLKDIHKRYVMYQLINAIKYIHSGNVIHRDLKPSNILIDSKCRCKLADFGLARSVTNRESANEDNLSVPLLTDYVATRWYRAPEILVASKRYTKGIDMWSLGCILGEMLRGKPLFQGTSTINQIERIVTALPAITERDIEAVGADFGAVLLSKQISREQKVSIEEVLGEVPNDALNLIKSLLVLDPLARLTAHQALEHPYITRFRHSIVENDLRVDIVPPFSDDVRLTVTEYRSKLYEIVDGVPATRASGKAANVQIKQKSSTHKLKVSGSRRELKVNKDSQDMQTMSKTKAITQNEIKMRCNQEHVPIKANSPIKMQNVPIRTMISSLTTKAAALPRTDISMQSKDLVEAKVLRNVVSRKRHKTKSIANTTFKLENTHSINNNNNQTCSQEMSPNNGSNYSSYNNKSKIYANNAKQLKANTISQMQLQQQQEPQIEQIHVNNMKNSLGNNINQQQQYVNNMNVLKDKLCSKKIQHNKQYADEKITAAQTTYNNADNDNITKNLNRSINNNLDEQSTSKISHMYMDNNLLLTRENFKKWIANHKNKPTSTTSLNRTMLERQQNSNNVNQLLPYVTTDLSNDECHCYEERLRRIEEEIQSYKQEVKTFAHDTLLLTHQRLKSADNNKLYEATAALENLKLPKSTRTLAANYIDNAKICNKNCNLNSINKIGTNLEAMETNIKAGLTNLPPVNAKNSIYQLITSTQNRKPNHEIGSGGSGDHLVLANSQFTKHFDYNSTEYQQESLQLKRNVKTHLQTPSQESQQFSYVEAKANGNKRKTTYVY